MLDSVAQAAIFLFCLGSIYLTNDPRPNVRRWACISGLASEPFWFYTTYTHHQWGIFVSAFFYTYAWARGCFHTWIKRPPDFIIGPMDDPQTKRWHLVKWRGIQVALHRWCRSDSDRALHDHSAGNVSILLTGWYREHFNHAWEKSRSKLRLPLIPYYRKADTPHRVELTGGQIWTLWIRFKPWRDWGFYCPNGWLHWTKFVSNRDAGNGTTESTVGGGCG